MTKKRLLNLLSSTVITACMCCSCSSEESSLSEQPRKMEVNVVTQYKSHSYANTDYGQIYENICDCITDNFSGKGEYKRIASPIDWGKVASYSYWQDTDKNRFEVDITGFDSVRIFFDIDIYITSEESYREIDEAIVETTDGVTKAYDIVDLGVNSIWGYNKDTSEVFLIWHYGKHLPDCDCLLVQ